LQSTTNKLMARMTKLPTNAFAHFKQDASDVLEYLVWEHSRHHHPALPAAVAAGLCLPCWPCTTAPPLWPDCIALSVMFCHKNIMHYQGKSLLRQWLRTAFEQTIIAGSKAALPSVVLIVQTMLGVSTFQQA
jgi:hypothetical protein